MQTKDKFWTRVSVRRGEGKVITVCVLTVPGHAEWFIWNKQNPQRNGNITRTLWDPALHALHINSAHLRSCKPRRA